MIYNLRNIAAFFYSFILYRRIKKVKDNAKNGEILLSVYFHNPSGKLFEFIVKWFKKNEFNFISTEQLNGIIKNKKELPSSSVILTVDDGWKENKANIVEVAEKYNIPVTFFITVKPVETGEGFWWTYASIGKKNKIFNYTINELKKLSNEKKLIEINKVKSQYKITRDALTIDEVKEISQNDIITIGSHTLTHPILTKCTDAVSNYEISESKMIIESWIRKPVNYFAYPNGNYSKREIQYLIDSDYELSFCTKPDYIRKEVINYPYEIPRFDVLENVSAIENICRATGVWFKKM